MAQGARTDIGFQGGQVLTLRIGDEAYQQARHGPLRRQEPLAYTPYRR